jgi:hypothetical protein
MKWCVQRGSLSAWTQIFMCVVLWCSGTLAANAQTGDCGVNWQQANPLPTQILGVQSVTYGDVVFSGGEFVATAGFPGGFLTSPTGLDWTWVKLFGTQIFYDVTWGGDQFVAVGTLRTTSAGIATSPDGVTWTAHDPGTTNSLYGVIWNGSKYVAVGGASDVRINISTISISSDGENWTAGVGNLGQLRSVAWGGEKFVAVGRGPLNASTSTYGQAPILTSPDGVSWTAQHSGTTQILYDVIWGDNQFVAVGSGSLDGTEISAIMLTSRDGVTWTRQNSGTTNDLHSVAWGGNRFVAVGAKGTILTSPDGKTWTASTSGTTSLLSGITWREDQFVAVGSPSTILTSPCK